MKEKIIMLAAAVILTLGTVTATAYAVRGAVPTLPSEADTEEFLMETKKNGIEEIRVDNETVSREENVDRNAPGANGFSFALIQQLLADKEENENLIVSPYSVWLPLAALSNAAEDEVKEELFVSLGYEDITQEQFNQEVLKLNSQLMQEERRVMMKEYGEEWTSPLQIANALFVDQDETVNKAFEQTFVQEYGGGLFSVNFADSAAVDTVNAWASEKTQGKIEKVLETMDPRTAAAIANAVYFADGWSTVFQEEDTCDALFHSAVEEQNVPFMNHRFSQNLYFEDKYMQATALDTNNGGHLILMLPKDDHSAEEVLAMTDQERLDVLSGADSCTVELSLPVFRVKSEPFSVLEQLRDMGVVITDDSAAHLNGLVEGEPLTISQAVQSAMIEVDEKGMTAAAVSVMGLMRMSMPVETESVELVFNKPFAFLLTMETQDFGQQVLFGGVVNHIEE